MTKPIPEAPPANRSPKGPGDHHEVGSDAATHRPHDPNPSEQGDTANIRQNTTTKGFFRGRRMK